MERQILAEVTLFEFLRELPTPGGAVSAVDLRKDTASLAKALRPSWEQSVLGPAKRGEMRDEMVIKCARRGLGGAGDIPQSILFPVFAFVQALLAEEPLLNISLEEPPPELTFAELLSERARLLELHEVLKKPEPWLDQWCAVVGSIIGIVFEGLPPLHSEGIACETDLIDVKPDVAASIAGRSLPIPSQRGHFSPCASLPFPLHLGQFSHSTLLSRGPLFRPSIPMTTSVVSIINY
jgi:hypothetical protein